MSMAASGGETGHLKVTFPTTLEGMTFRVDAGRTVVGRAAGSGLRIDHPDVSRTHAALEHRAGRTIIEDLGSTHGTAVNGAAIHQPQQLHHGDVVRFGSVVAVFEEPSGVDSPTGALGWLPATPPPAGVADIAHQQRGPSPAARFDVDQQHGGWISNVGGNQYVMAERQSFLREIASARTRARRIILVGFLLFLAGFAGQVWVMYEYSAGFERLWRDFQADPAAGQPEMPELALRLATVSTGAMSLGIVLMLVGLVLHMVTTARRRRIDDPRLLPSVGPPPPDSAPYPHPGGPGGLQHRQPTGRRRQQRRG